MKNKIFCISLLLLFCQCTKNQDSQNSPSKEKVLQLYCWTNYFSPQMIQAFEKKTNSKVIINYFSSNEELLAKLQAGAKGYDLIVPSGYLIRALKTLNLIEPLGELNWPELKKLIPRASKPDYDPLHEYTIPYAWGTTGIAINRAKIKGKVDSWAWVFNHPEFKGKITMLEDAPAVVGAALKYLGYSYNESRPEVFAKAKELLIKQKPLLKAYTIEHDSFLVTGEVALAHIYSGDSLQIRKKNPHIEYVLPKEGSEIYMDNLAIPKGAASPDLAKEFIRFTLDTKMALLQTQHLFFSPVVDIRGLPGAEELFSNPGIFPSDYVLKNFEMASDDPKRIDLIQKIWIELKSI